MDFARWARLCATLFAIAFVVVAGAQALKGHAPRYAVTQKVLCGASSALVYVLAAIHRWRRAIRCAACVSAMAHGARRDA